MSVTPFQAATPPQLILFDLDGTLVDSVPGLAEAVDRMLVELGRPAVGEAAVRPWVGNGAAMLVKRALCNDFAASETIDPELQSRSLSLFLQHYADCLTHNVALYAGVQEFLQAMAEQQRQMAVVTNKPQRFIAPLLQALGIEQYFQLLVGGDTLANYKPHPEPLLYALSQLQVPAANALMIGDSSNDVLAARNALVPVACVSYGYNHGEPISAAAPDWVVDSMLELL